MKKFLLSLCLTLGLVGFSTSSYAANPSMNNEEPDEICVIIENGVIVDIIIIKHPA